MNTLELKSMDLELLSMKESEQIQGGFLWLLANALVLGVFAAAGAAIYARFEAGYAEACKC
jgi:hypothetical protein